MKLTDAYNGSIGPSEHNVRVKINLCTDQQAHADSPMLTRAVHFSGEAKLSKPGSWSLQACCSVINSVSLREGVMDEMIPRGPPQTYFVWFHGS